MVLYLQIFVTITAVLAHEDVQRRNLPEDIYEQNPREVVVNEGTFEIILNMFLCDEENDIKGIKNHKI